MRTRYEATQKKIAGLPTIRVGRQSYLSYQAITDAAAAFLFPAHPADQIDKAGYQRILETADSLCRELGYVEIVKLTPPEVPLNQMGLYWSAAPRPAPEPELEVIHIGPNERLFTVIIRGPGRRRYWHFKARLQQDDAGAPFLYICLSDEAGTDGEQLFPLGHVVMTPGAAALRVDFAPCLARHAAGDWGEVDAFDRHQNDTAVKEGYRILSAYDVPIGDGKTERIWIITEADRSCTTVLLPAEY